MANYSNNASSPWPHRMAVALVCATFLLLVVGALVTTTASGMAVPDWPQTYEHNMVLYPLTQWLQGPTDIFIEHGHRLMGMLVGLMTIALLGILLRYDSRRWMKVLGVITLIAVIAQGILGGLRVLMDARILAMAHGCTGPLFLALTAASVVGPDFEIATSFLAVNPTHIAAVQTMFPDTVEEETEPTAVTAG